MFSYARNPRKNNAAVYRTGRCVRNIAHGYRLAADGDHVAPESSEQAALAQILALGGEGRSLRQIAVALNRQALRTRRGAGLRHDHILRVMVTKLPDSGYCRTVTLTETASHIAACALLPAFDIS